MTTPAEVEEALKWADEASLFNEDFKTNAQRSSIALAAAYRAQAETLELCLRLRKDEQDAHDLIILSARRERDESRAALAVSQEREGSLVSECITLEQERDLALAGHAKATQGLALTLKERNEARAQLAEEKSQHLSTFEALEESIAEQVKARDLNSLLSKEGVGLIHKEKELEDKLAITTKGFDASCRREDELREILKKAEARLKLCDDGTPDARGKFRVIEAEAQLAELKAHPIWKTKGMYCEHCASVDAQLAEAQAALSGRTVSCVCGSEAQLADALRMKNEERSAFLDRLAEAFRGIAVKDEALNSVWELESEHRDCYDEKEGCSLAKELTELLAAWNRRAKPGEPKP